MKDLLLTAPNGALPEVVTPAYKILSILDGRDRYPRDLFCDELGGGFRAYLQQLTGDRYQNWNILVEKGVFNGKQQNFYYLDERHFSQEWEQDKDARAVARKRYKDRAYYGAESAVKRLEKAQKEKELADTEYRQMIESKKPTKV